MDDSENVWWGKEMLSDSILYEISIIGKINFWWEKNQTVVASEGNTGTEWGRNRRKTY